MDLAEPELAIILDEIARRLDRLEIAERAHEWTGSTNHETLEWESYCTRCGTEKT